MKTNSQWQLVHTKGMLALQKSEPNSPLIYVDFIHGKLGHRQQNDIHTKLPLARAMGITNKNKPSVIDTTAGMGTDGFIMAYLGCDVVLLERQELVYKILKDGLDRLSQDNNYKHLKLKLFHTNAMDYLKNLETKPDIIYCDPMYPHSNKSAKVKKAMAAFQELVGEDGDQIDLLKISLNTAKKRVVVKRPKSACFLANQKPHHSIHTKNHRFDVYEVR